MQKQLRGRLDKDDVARICHDLNFDEEKIDEKLAGYATEKKYQGLEQYEWQTT